jgi:hypothetical protein
MNEDELLQSVQSIDNLLSRCINPPLTRDEHGSIKQVIGIVVSRIKLSYTQEKELKDLKNKDKE